MLICPVVLYDLETWPVMKLEEIRLKVFEKNILRRIFGLYKYAQIELRIRRD